jgi:hypothetical protein
MALADLAEKHASGTVCVALYTKPRHRALDGLNALGRNTQTTSTQSNADTIVEEISPSGVTAQIGATWFSFSGYFTTPMSCDVKIWTTTVYDYVDRSRGGGL